MRIKDVRFTISAASGRQLPENGLPEVAFVGRSNVGKSSLLNMLAGRRNLARTSSVPGKTRTINCYKVNNEAYFHDLPGLGYAKVSRTLRKQWLRLIADYLTYRKTLRAVVHLIDSRHPPMPADRDLLVMMRPRAIGYLVALTKVDKLSGNARAASKRRMEETLFECGVNAPIVMSSAKTRRGREELLRHIGACIDDASLT